MKKNKVIIAVAVVLVAFVGLFLVVPKFKTVVLNLWNSITGKKKAVASQSQLT
jgi:hypothetical protein